jgi:phosphatidylserine/phosphatidylglycerophosphate/cardiolipin synthase-like enzyme
MKRNVSIVWGALLLALVAVVVAVAAHAEGGQAPVTHAANQTPPGALTVLPEDGRSLYLGAIDAARREISIEICVLEDPQILQHVQRALQRGVHVRALVDRGKYQAVGAERTNLARFVTASGGELHLSNPMFPRSFPKVILVDAATVVYGSACLDETTFAQYRDFAQSTSDPRLFGALHDLFENDWTSSAAPGVTPPAFAPTPPLTDDDLIVSPVNASARMTALYQSARTTLDVYTELLGNRSLESELVAAVKRGVRVQVITPVAVNGATRSQQTLQTGSIAALRRAGVAVHVSGPQESAQRPYMHARAAVVDGRTAYLGSISLSPDSTTTNREVGLILDDPATVTKLGAQFASDFQSLAR